MSKKINRLSAQQSHLLNKWLEDRAESMRGKARTEIARAATVDLLFVVTTANISGAEGATGLVVGRTQERPSAKPEPIQQFLAKTMLELATQLGHSTDPRLAAIAAGSEA